MSLKVKLTSTIVAFMLILGLTIMGVFAAPTATIQLGGSLNFKATDVHAKVTGVIAGTKADPQPTLTDLVFEAGETTDVSSWANVPLQFTDAGSEITITVTIENLATDRPLYATITDKIGQVDNVTHIMKIGEEEYTGSVITIPKKETQGNANIVVVDLVIDVYDANTSIVENSIYGYEIDLNNVKPAEPQEPAEPTLDASQYTTLTFAYDDEDDKTLSVSANSSNSPTGELVIPAKVVYEGQECTVKSIASGAFSFCSELTSIVIPNSVTSIGGSAFLASGLVSIVIPDSVTSIGSDCFMDCTELTSIKIPNGVTSLGSAAFYGCIGLTSIKIPNGVTSLENQIFKNCSRLSSIVIPISVTSIEIESFEGCIVLTDVYYTGSGAEWEVISIEVMNEPLVNATKHFNYVPSAD